MDRDKWAAIREENRAIMENIQQYLANLNTVRELADSPHERLELGRSLLDYYRRMRLLSHAADVQIAKAGEWLMLDEIRSEVVESTEQDFETAGAVRNFRSTRGGGSDQWARRLREQPHNRFPAKASIAVNRVSGRV